MTELHSKMCYQIVVHFTLWALHVTSRLVKSIVLSNPGSRYVYLVLIFVYIFIIASSVSFRNSPRICSFLRKPSTTSNAKMDVFAIVGLMLLVSRNACFAVEILYELCQNLLCYVRV